MFFVAEIGAVLHVVADELNEVGTDQVVHLIHDPQGRAVVGQVRFGQVEVAGDDDGDGGTASEELRQ